MKFWFVLGILCTICLSLAAFIQFGFVTRAYTPAGHEGYVYEEPRVFGEGGFVATLEGAGSYGPTLRRVRVVNIDTRAQSHDETIAVPAGAGSIELKCNVLVRAEQGRVKDIVENYGGEDWYRAHVRPSLIEVLQAGARAHTTELVFNADTDQLSAETMASLSDALHSQGAPFVIEKVLIREMHLPPGVQLSKKPAVKESGSTAVNVASTRLQPVSPTENSNSPANLPPASERIQISHKREFRGVWMATASNIDWPSKEGMKVADQQAELIGILDTMEEMRMNALVLQVRGAADAIYDSPYEPWAKWLMGKQGEAPEPYYDPLTFAVEECHRRNIELHAWINPYRAHTQDKYDLAPNHVANVLRDHCVPYGNQMWMDPGSKVVQEWIVNVVSDIVKRYDVDGVHLDDYFYPYPKAGKPFPDDPTYQRYLAEVGHLDLGDWRRQNVNTLIYRLSEEIRKVKPGVKFGIGPFGLYRPGEPEGTKGLDQYTQIFADPKKWLDNGWIDYISPQLYWSNASNRSYTKLLDWWSTNNPLRRHIYAGSSLLTIGKKTSELTTQVKASRAAHERQSLGNLFFGWKFLAAQRGSGLRKHFREKLYTSPALPPAMPWLAAGPPECPKELKQEGNALLWKTPKGGSAIRAWTLYQQQKDTSWELKAVIPAGEKGIHVVPGTYALCAVDRVAQESVGTVISIEPEFSIAQREDDEHLAPKEIGDEEIVDEENVDALEVN